MEMFYKSLEIMGLGMAGVFIVTAVIVAAMLILSKISGKN